jgi:hypothetical protein
MFLLDNLQVLLSLVSPHACDYLKIGSRLNWDNPPSDLFRRASALRS